MHALLYLVISLLAVAVCFYLMGAPFAAGLEVIVYAGAILVLFVFAVMMFGLTKDETRFAPQSNGVVIWMGPCLLATCLLFLLVGVIQDAGIQQQLTMNVVDAKQVGTLLYTHYLYIYILLNMLLVILL